MAARSAAPRVQCRIRSGFGGRQGKQVLELRLGERAASRHGGLSQLECRLLATVRQPSRNKGLRAAQPGRVQLGQRAALYCRVSTADQSCARQERDLAAFAARAGYEVVGIFKETGSGVKLDRAERRKVHGAGAAARDRRGAGDRAVALGPQHDGPAGTR